MGSTCCRQGDEYELRSVERPDTGISLTPIEEINERAAKPNYFSHSPSLTKGSQPSFSRYIEYTEQIIKTQALVRGFLTRKGFPTKSSLKPATVIKYITSQMRAVKGAATVSTMEPFEVDWDMNEFKGKLQLRKATVDSKGNVYIGYWNPSTNKKEGYGQELYITGAKYEGFWLNGEYEGKGRLIHQNGDFYAGMWKKGKAEGFGTFVGVDGMKYIGEWKAGEHHGKGQEIWTDGSVFEGQYVNGEKEGHGKFVWSDRSYYEGGFSKSMMSSEGKYVWSDGRIYEGTWKDNMMNGKGKFKFASGKTYVGDFVDDRREGLGKMTWPDGKVYEGHWEAGAMHGQGKMTYPDGTVKEGEWVHGKEPVKKNGKPQPTPLFTLIPLDLDQVKNDDA